MLPLVCNLSFEMVWTTYIAAQEGFLCPCFTCPVYLLCYQVKPDLMAEQAYVTGVLLLVGFCWLGTFDHS